MMLVPETSKMNKTKYAYCPDKIMLKPVEEADTYMVLANGGVDRMLKEKSLSNVVSPLS